MVSDEFPVGRYIKTGTNPAFFPKGILIEGQRTNLLTHSEQFDDAAWTKPYLTIAADNTTAPDGNGTADKITEDTNDTEHRIFTAVTLGDNSPQAFSIFAKAGERTWIALNIRDKAGTESIAWYNLATGAVGTVQAGVTAGIESVGSDGWYRCSIKMASVGVGASGLYAIAHITSGDGVISYQGDNTSSIYLWGAQLEAAPFASSYIPTTTAAVTRNADVLTFPTASNVSGTVGTLVMEASLNDNIIAGTQRQIIDSSKLYRSGSSGKIIAYDGTNTLGVTPWSADGPVKLGIRWGGSTMSTVYSTTIANGSFDGDMNYGATAKVGGITMLFGNVKSLKIWNRALTDAEMIAITS